MNNDDWNPVEDRRAFLAAVGAAGAGGVAGCSSSGDDGGSGGEGDGSGDDGSGDGDDPDGPGGGTTSDDLDGVDPQQNEQIPEERAQFAVPVEDIETNFDAAVSEGTTVLHSENMDALVDGSPEEGYVFDESQLDGELQEGDVLLISGVDLARVVGVDRSGSNTAVETESASLDEAIEDGQLGWDAELSADFAYSPDDENRETIDPDDQGRLGPPAGAGVATGGAGAVEGAGFFTGVEMVGAEGTEQIPLAAMTVAQQSLQWQFTQGGREFTFRVERSDAGETTIRAQVVQPAGGDANLAFTAEGSVGPVQSRGDVRYSDSELQEFEFNQDNVTAEFEVSMSAAGAQDGEFSWEFPGVMFKYVIFVGPVPVTLSVSTQLVANITVPSVEGSATGTSRFDYSADTGFRYQGTDVDVEASVGDQPLDPQSADAAANIGNPVDLQFGIAYPRVEISVFEQTMIPFIQFGMTIGSRLSWGPLCKSGYVRMNILAGYDFEILGQSLASEEVSLYEDIERSEGDSCE